MKPLSLKRAPRRAAPALIAPATSLADLLDGLAARMGPDQRGAFLAKMAAMDRGERLTAAATTLGRA